MLLSKYGHVTLRYFARYILHTCICEEISILHDSSTQVLPGDLLQLSNRRIERYRRNRLLRTRKRRTFETRELVSQYARRRYNMKVANPDYASGMMKAIVGRIFLIAHDLKIVRHFCRRAET